MRAMDLVDRLGFIRRVVGRCPEWLVDYEARDIPEAMRACEADLSRIDPSWMKVLDFRALPRNSATLSR